MGNYKQTFNKIRAFRVSAQGFKGTSLILYTVVALPLMKETVAAEQPYYLC